MYNPKLLQAIRKSGWLLGELAGLVRIPEPVLYRILTGITDPDPGTQERLATVLGIKTSDIFN
jgi:ribosome-binding protein aMBF1 (putative translation factor)